VPGVGFRGEPAYAEDPQAPLELDFVPDERPRVRRNTLLRHRGKILRNPCAMPVRSLCPISESDERFALDDIGTRRPFCAPIETLLMTADTAISPGA